MPLKQRNDQTNLHPKMKLPWNKILKNYQFLDTFIKTQNSYIITDIYHKPIDTKQYRLFKSHHPKSWLKSIPYALARGECTRISYKNIR